MTVELTIEDAEDIAFELARQMMAISEPMPEFWTRPRHKLETVLQAPFASFDGIEKYPEIDEKAAVLFYAACKDHPLQNGNKRMAVVLTVVFLVVNEWWLDLDPIALYELARKISRSWPRTRDRKITELTTIFRAGMVPLANTPGGSAFLARRN